MAYRMFNQQELQVLLGGVNAPIDVDDLRSHTNYGGLYDDNEPTIVAFWNVSLFLVAYFLSFLSLNSQTLIVR